MRGKKRFNQGDDTTDINISPLIDMVFILLIFFIVTTVFVEEKGLATNTPDPTQSKDEPNKEDRLSLIITTEGQVLAKIGPDTRDIGFGGVGAAVKNEMQRERYPIMISIENEAPMDYYARVHDSCITAGAVEITLKAIDAD